jgi:translation elongation factor EF-4
MVHFDGIETPVHVDFSLNVRRITTAKLQGDIVVIPGSSSEDITNMLQH